MVLHKKGIPYNEIRSQIRSFDMIAFRGNDFVSDAISKVESYENGYGEYTHVGMIILGDMFPIDSYLHDPNKIYVFESTMSGSLGDGVKNVDSKSFLGTQLRDFDLVIANYDNHEKTQIAWCQLKQEYRPNISMENWISIFNKYNKIRYDANCITLISSASKCMRYFKKFLNILYCCWCCNKNLQFCSELVTNLYKELGVLNKNVQSEHVIPSDYFASSNDPSKTYDMDKEIPVLFNKYVKITYYS